MLKKRTNQVFDFEGDTFLLVDSRKHGKFLILIDAVDVVRIAEHNWHLLSNRKCLDRDALYFKTNIRNADGSRGMLSLHRLIVDAPDDIGVDHIHHSFLDLRKSELRLATQNQNGKNKSKHRKSSNRFKGVHYYKSSNKWRAHIGHDGRLIHLGYFAHTPEGETEAACAYDLAAIRYHGEFALVNFPDEKN